MPASAIVQEHPSIAMLTLGQQAPALLPAWVVLPLALIALVVVAGHWILLGKAQMPRFRKALRSANGVVMMLAIPVLAYGFGVVSPGGGEADKRQFVLTWLVASGMMVMVLVLAMVDLSQTWWEAWQARKALRRELVEARRAMMAALGKTAPGDPTVAMHATPQGGSEAGGR